MSLNLSAKKEIVAEISDIATKTPSVIAAEYSGLTVAQMTELRNVARSAGVYLRVVRNTLARRAFEDTPLKCMNDSLVGPLVLAFSNDDPGSAARIIRDFIKDDNELTVKLIVLNGELLEPSDLSRLANMPSLNEARSMLLGLLSAPLSQFVRTLSEPSAKLVRVMSARRDQQST